MNNPENRQKLPTKEQVKFPQNLDEMFQLGNLPQGEFNDMMEKLSRVSNIGENREIKQQKPVEQEPEKGPFTTFRSLWAATKPDCRGALIGEMLNNPVGFIARLRREDEFQRNLNRRWKR